MKQLAYIIIFSGIGLLVDSCSDSGGVHDSFKFLNRWLMNDTCSAGSNQYQLNITGNISYDEITLSNLGGFGDDFKVKANVSGDSFSIHSQQVQGYTITGSGYLNEPGDTLSYQWEGSSIGNCFAVGTILY